MKINQTQLYAAINEYITREIVPLGATMDFPKQVLFGVRIGVVKRKIEDIVKSYLTNDSFKFLELVDSAGNIDIETIYNAALDTLQQVTQIDIGGITFKVSDLQKLYGIMQKYANQGVAQ
jgi:hypothetical protein